MVRTNLVIVRAGDASLHPQWLTSEDRNWDLVVLYAGNYPDRYRNQYDELYRHNGSKWAAVTEFLSTRSGFVQQYEYVWFPDDDLLTTGRNINSFFELCKTFGFRLAQPAFTSNSYYAWEITLQRPTLAARVTNFVEIAAPCFKVATFEVFASVFGENTSGYGYEWVWSHLADRNGELRRGIVDRTPVFRTRPVGFIPGAVGNPAEEELLLLQRYEMLKFPPLTFQEIPWTGLV